MTLPLDYIEKVGNSNWGYEAALKHVWPAGWSCAELLLGFLLDGTVIGFITVDQIDIARMDCLTNFIL